MGHVLTVVLAVVVGAVALSGGAQGEEPRRYSYHVWGQVSDESARPRPKTNVCFVPAERPINGRIPCTKTDAEGNFALTVRDVPDKYRVCASTAESPFLFERDKEEGHRATCTEALTFGARDECRQASLRFQTK